MTASPTTDRVRDAYGWLTASEIHRRDRARQDEQLLTFSCTAPGCAMEPFEAAAAEGRARMADHRDAGHTAPADDRSLMASLTGIVAKHVALHGRPEPSPDPEGVAAEPQPSGAVGGGRSVAAAAHSPIRRDAVHERLAAAHAGVTVARGFDLEQHLARVADVARNAKAKAAL